MNIGACLFFKTLDFQHSRFLFGCLAKARLSIPTPRHRLVFALIGIIAPLVWGAASLVFAAMLYTALNSPPKR